MVEAAAYPIVVRPIPADEGGGYQAHAVDLLGCIGDGSTQEEAIRDVLSAIAEWVDEARRLGRPVPEPGSGVQRLHEERRQFQQLLQLQDELIEEHQARFEELSRRIENMKQQISLLQDAEGRESSRGDQWDRIDLAAMRLASLPAH